MCLRKLPNVLANDIDVSLAWMDNNINSSDCFGGQNVCDSRWVFSLSKQL